ncbi:MAG: NAD(P)/FAD-dependent oxidoreductase [Pseudomonadales bacterium]|nr:NAD(P)/FAD-dependent oxidoreductase [Pseudomonadales bacterium]
MNNPAQQSELRFAIIGGGMAGILSAIKLNNAGYSNYTIYEKADSLGGTWRENTYPGIACDVPSHFYCYDFEPNPDWSYACSPGPEILDYFNNVAKKYGVLEKTRFGSEVSKLEFIDNRWQLETKDGAKDTIDIVISASGVLHHPSFPDIDGLDTFAGTLFHTAEWDHSVPLAGKRIGIIGTGSSAIQIVGALADKAGKLVQFQRTAQWIMPRENPAYTDAEKDNFRANPDAMQAIRSEQAEMSEGGFSAAVVGENPAALAAIEALTLSNLEDNVKDPILREKLRPDYTAACKRLIMSPNYYDAIQHPNAQLVTEDITAIEPTGVRTADGELHEFDILVIATGFKVDQFMRPIEVIGQNGITLEQAWVDRPSAYLSVSVPGFPNLALLNGPNGPVGNFSLIDVADIQLDYFLQLVESVRDGQCAAFSAKAAAAESAETERVEATKNTVWVSGCKSWYLDDRGVPAVWPWSMGKFRDVMTKPDMDDYDLAS